MVDIKRKYSHFNSIAFLTNKTIAQLESLHKEIVWAKEVAFEEPSTQLVAEKYIDTIEKATQDLYVVRQELATDLGVEEFDSVL